MRKLLFLFTLTVGALFAQTPIVTGIANNYSGINVGSVARGAIFIVVGSNLSNQSTNLQSVPLQTGLQGVRIEIVVNGVSRFAPMYYVLPAQLAGILPSDVPEGTGLLYVHNNGRTSVAAPITVVRSAFGVLTVNGAGSGAARVQDASQGYQELTSVRATNPGNVLVFYGSGVGPVSGDETIQQTQTDLTSIPIAVTIGGKPATVLYRGRTVFPGLDQINVQVPTLDANMYGCAVPVSITTNGISANLTTIPVAVSGSSCPAPSGGGGGTDPAPTSDEISSWSARGNYVSGTISMNRTVTYNGAAITRADTAGGAIQRVTGSGAEIAASLRGELPPGYPRLNPSAGSCLTYRNSQLSNPYPSLVYTYLDAGPQWTMTGPNGSRPIPRQTFQVNGPTYNTLSTLANTYLSPGAYTFSGPGGTQVGSFNGSLTIVNDLVVTNPEAFTGSISVNAPLTVRWTGGEGSNYATIQGISYAADFSATIFVCVELVSAGQFTVPANIVSQLPPTPTGGIVDLPGSFSVTAGGKGVRFAPPSGVDLLTAFNFWSWQFTPKWQ